MNKIASLTSVRFIAATLVVLYHIRAMEIPLLKPLTDMSPYVISFFFVLSGFVMALVYFRPGNTFKYRDFWVARISRVYPIYLLSLLLACIHYIDVLSKIKPIEYYSSVLLFQTWIPKYALSFNFPAWTLAVDILFYLLFPLLIFLANKLTIRWLIWISLFYWIVNQLFRQVLIQSGLNLEDTFVAYFPVLHLDAFLLGFVGGVWYLVLGKNMGVKQIINQMVMFFCMGVIIIMVWVLNVGDRLGALSGFFSPLFVIVILTLCFDQSNINKVLSHRWLVKLGESSYSLYIFHIPVLWLISDLLLHFGKTASPLTLLLTYVPFMIGLSVLIFRYIELPTHNWLRENPLKILLIVIDLFIISASFFVSFFLRVGYSLDSHARSINFSLRTGLPVIFILLIFFRIYQTKGMETGTLLLKKMILPLILGYVLLSGLMYVGVKNAWLESFPRTFPIIGVIITTSMLYLSRIIYKKWAPGLII